MELLFVVFLILITIKLIGLLAIPWIWVMIPVIGMVLIVVIAMIACAVVFCKVGAPESEHDKMKQDMDKWW
ncbi:hypothetical protein NBRC111893_2478 [Lentilactobacillus kosonis]|uniref:Uncharacterized protein n=1 Tax=Lentilactobacillus kosonis TaxID=2810561 RepID=A0A401FPN5_9LACO|nr:hypothetical protein NBRC111893_2478 [Lentilactobacillus kosonis]